MNLPSSTTQAKALRDEGDLLRQTVTMRVRMLFEADSVAKLAERIESNTLIADQSKDSDGTEQGYKQIENRSLVREQLEDLK